jgi:hypothetical protein
MEKYKLFSFVLSGSVFLMYWLYIYLRYGIQKSISDSYYNLGNKGFIFTLTLWGFSLPLIIVGESGLMFFAGAFICFTGAAADFKKKITNTVHFVGAVGGIIFGLLSLILDFGQTVMAIATVSMSCTILFFNVNNKIWWIETLTFVGIYIGMLISNIK